MNVSTAPPAPVVATPARAPGNLAPEPTGPYPVRFAWLKRLSLVCVMVALSLGVLRAWWGWHAERALRQALAPVVAAGEPVTLEQMQSPPIPAGRNAAAYLKAAFAAIVFNDSPASSSATFGPYPPWGNLWDRMAEISVKQNAKVFPLARAARAYDETDWGTQMRRPGISVLLPHLNNARHLANTVGDAALYAHFRGDDAAALETVRDVRHIAVTLEGERFLVSHLVHVGIEMLAMHRLQVIATGLRVAPEDAPPPAGPLLPTAARAQLHRPAGRGQVRALIAELLDERGLTESLHKALAGERVAQIDTTNWFGEQTWVLRPMYQLDGVRMVGYDQVLMEVAAQPNVPAAKAALAAATARRPLPGLPSASAAWFPASGVPASRQYQPVDYTRIVSDNLLAGYSSGRTFQQHLRAITERRMGAVNLAVQLYRADYGGQWPPTLETLVPQYLPQVPYDALAPGDKPLGYVVLKGALPDGSDRPLVYSIGSNEVDDTAKGMAPPNVPCYGWQNNRDEWRDLTRWTPGMPSAAAPSTQAVDHQPDEADDPGKDR